MKMSKIPLLLWNVSSLLPWCSKQLIYYNVLMLFPQCGITGKEIRECSWDTWFLVEESLGIELVLVASSQCALEAVNQQEITGFHP